MSDAKGKNLIVLSAIITLGLGFLNSYLVKRKNPRIRLFIGAMILYLGLTAWAEFDAKTAGYFAVLIMITALLMEGGGVLNYLMGRGTHDNISNAKTTTGTPTPGVLKDLGTGLGNLAKNSPLKIGTGPNPSFTVPLTPPVPGVKGGVSVRIPTRGPDPLAPGQGPFDIHLPSFHVSLPHLNIHSPLHGVIPGLP